tara:strand:- start:697 stop:1260 length:564 start_codon:yes stop_codon:yes gene_type:complete
MILISIEGGTEKQRDLGEDAIRFFVKKLVPEKEELLIDLKIHNLIQYDIAGFCEYVDENEVNLESHNRGTLYDYITFIAHECIHMKQYLTGELTTEGKVELWHGEDFTGLPYKEQPWEIEAWEGQHALAKEFIKKELGITLKLAKTMSPRTLKKMDWSRENKFTNDIIEKRKIHGIKTIVYKKAKTR